MAGDFQEANLWSTRIRDLGLKIPGTRLEPIIAEFERELARLKLRVKPRFYLSTEWGVPFDTVALAIPFYLAHPELTRLHEKHAGMVEGFNKADILRYLRHEMGHVVNYAYRLYDELEWVQLFGSMTQPYEEEYRPQPFSRRFVRHLPGWYAQKHPDEDWAETFAVRITPRQDWRAEYKDWPTALTKLEFCDRTLSALPAQNPLVTDDELDEDVDEVEDTVGDYYTNPGDAPEEFPPGLDGALRAIFATLADERTSKDEWKLASTLISELERDLTRDVFRWTGHFPERTRLLMRHLGERAERLDVRYPADNEQQAIIALTTLITALAMNHVHGGSYSP